MIKTEEVIKIGRFAKTHGVKGELALLANSELFERSEEDLYVVCDIDGILVPFFVESCRFKSDSVVLVKLDYVNNEESAREFINKEVYFPLAFMPEDDNLIGDITWDSFIGYTVSDKEHGLLGKVIDVDESTINILLHIDYNGNTLMFPAAEELINEVDHSTKQLVVFVPEGLLDL